MARHTTLVGGRSCAWPASGHEGLTSAYQLVNRNTGAVHDFDICEGHARLLLQPVIVHARVGVPVVPADRPVGRAGWPYRLRWGPGRRGGDSTDTITPD
jgi:hypothetical protein